MCATPATSSDQSMNQSSGTDGFVSLEVSPHLAHATQASIDEARRLAALKNRRYRILAKPAKSFRQDGFCIFHGRLVKEAMENFESDWNNVNRRIMISPGKKIFAALNGKLQTLFGISITSAQVIKPLTSDDASKRHKRYQLNGQGFVAGGICRIKGSRKPDW